MVAALAPGGRHGHRDGRLRGTGLPVVVAVGLFTLATLRRDRVLVAVTAATGHDGRRLVDRRRPRWAELVVLGVVEAGFFIAVGRVARRRGATTSSSALRDRAARAEAEQERRAEQARLAERSRIAREMHDVLAHKVALIAMHAGALEVRRDPTPEEVVESARLIRTTARAAMDDLRDVLGVLRDASDGSDLVPPARRDDIARRSTRRTPPVSTPSCGWGSTTCPTGSPGRPTGSCRRGSRTCTSTRRARPRSSRSAATRRPASAGVTVVNDRPSGRAGRCARVRCGLLGLRERVALLGGTLSAGRCPDGGWHLAAWLPWSGA